MNYLHDFWTGDLVDAFHPVIRASVHGRDAIRATYAAVDETVRLKLTETVANGRLPLLATSAFVLPILSAEGCRDVVERSTTYVHTPNADELPAYQINEAVLAEVDPDFDALMQRVLMTALSPWFLMIWGRLPSHLSSLQIASYDPETIAETALHIDRDSSFTAVISLNPHEFDGGGTMIADGLVGDFTIPPLPTGHALIFDGQRTLHRGLPAMGNRKLLVIWADQSEDIW